MEQVEGHPSICVVIPTHGRYHLLIALFESLRAAREHFQRPVEVFIIDSSPQVTAERIEAICSEFNAHYIRHRNNVREKRNLGIELARAPVILFVDSDCVLTPAVLLEHYRSYGEDSIAGVVGVTQFVGKSSHIWRIIAKTSFLNAFSYAERLEFAPWGPTCNISYRKDVLEAVGKFDTSFPFRLGGDDTDLGLRVTAAGYKIRCNPQAIVEHTRETWSGIRLIGRRVFRWGRMHFHMMQKHPHRVFVNPPTIPGIFLLLALLFAPLGLVGQSAVWATIPLVWLFLDLNLESLLISHKQGRQPTEFFYTLGSRILALIFQVGTVLEGIKNSSLTPLYKDISYTPPSSKGRRRGVAQIWAMMLAFPLAILILVIVQLIFRNI